MFPRSLRTETLAEEVVPSHCFLCSEQCVHFGAEESWLGLVSGAIRGFVFLPFSQLSCPQEGRGDTAISSYPMVDDGCFVGFDAMDDDDDKGRRNDVGHGRSRRSKIK